MAFFVSSCDVWNSWFSGNLPDAGKFLEAAVKRLHHRGPDSQGSFLVGNGKCGLAHARLAIQDLSPAGHQPMHSDDGEVTIVFNGEIYNFKSLRAKLEASGCSFSGGSDTEVLLQLYLVHRHRYDIAPFLRQLNGIFSFAIWDSRYECLWLARDSYGVKPLYYSQLNDFFAFSSEIKALSQIDNPCLQLDIEALDRYLTFLWAPGKRTPAKNIFKLGPGEVLRVREGRIDLHSRWFERPSFRSQSFLTQAQAIRGLQQHLRQAVHRQLLSDVPVGAFLSGGLDSSSVVAFARERNPDLRCFTIDVSGAGDEGFSDDLPYARRVATHLGVSLDVVQVDAVRMAEAWRRWCGNWTNHWPTLRRSMFSTSAAWPVSKASKSCSPAPVATTYSLAIEDI